MALALNLATFAALMLMFFGVWMVYGVGVAIIVHGLTLWCTCLYAAHLADRGNS